MAIGRPESIESATPSGGGAGYRGTGGGGTSIGGARPAYQIIERRGIFTFDEVHQLASSHFDQYRAVGADEELIEFTRDLVYLSAAEYSLLPATMSTVDPVLPLREPLRIGSQAITAAIIKADCGGLDYHYRRVGEGAVRMWDFALFGGDMSKIELIQGDRLDLGDVEELIIRLERRFADSQTTIGRLIGSSGMLRVQGLLWKAKLAVNVAPDDVEAQIDRYLERIPLTAP